MRRSSYILFLLFTLRAVAIAPEVVHVYPNRPWVAVTHDEQTPWERGDQLCLYREGMEGEGACGEILFVNQRVAIAKLTSYQNSHQKKEGSSKSETYVEISFNMYSPELGDTARLTGRDPKRAIEELARNLASQKNFGGESLVKVKKPEWKKPPETPPTSVASLGLNFTSFFMQYQQTITVHSAIGVRGIYLNQNIGEGNAKGIGGFITYDYYSEEDMKGVWVEGALGLYRLRATNGGTGSDFYAPCLNSTIGWRLVWRDHLTFGFGIGVQYLLASNFRQLGMDFTGILPSVIFDFGLHF
jgi:hypothetical protein